MKRWPGARVGVGCGVGEGCGVAVGIAPWQKGNLKDAMRVFHGAVPVLVVQVGSDGLRQLESLRGVVARVVEDRPRRPALSESVPRIQGGDEGGQPPLPYGRVMTSSQCPSGPSQ